VRASGQSRAREVAASAIWGNRVRRTFTPTSPSPSPLSLPLYRLRPHSTSHYGASEHASFCDATTNTLFDSRFAISRPLSRATERKQCATILLLSAESLGISKFGQGERRATITREHAATSEAGSSRRVREDAYTRHWIRIHSFGKW
jgi:hypothetical protein